MIKGKCQLDIMRDNIDGPKEPIGVLCPRCGREDCQLDWDGKREYRYNRENWSGWQEEDYYCPDCHWKHGPGRDTFRLRKETVTKQPGSFRLVPVAYTRVD